MSLGLGNTLRENGRILVLGVPSCVSMSVSIRVRQCKSWASTYSLILDFLNLATFQGTAVPLVLETPGSDQPLNLGSLGEGFLSLPLGLDLTADDVFSDLNQIGQSSHC